MTYNPDKKAEKPRDFKTQVPARKNSHLRDKYWMFSHF